MSIVHNNTDPAHRAINVLCDRINECEVALRNLVVAADEWRMTGHAVEAARALVDRRSESEREGQE